MAIRCDLANPELMAAGRFYARMALHRGVAAGNQTGCVAIFNPFWN